MIDPALVKSLAVECGFSLCGVVPAEELAGERPLFESWIGSGRASGLGYMERNLDKRMNPALLVEGGRSVIVCAVNYKNEAWNQPHDPAIPKLASYALAPEYHVTVKSMLGLLLARLRETYPDLAGRCFTDSAPVLEKRLAVRAGLGWTGRNSLLVTPDYGTFVILGEIIINDEAASYDRPPGRDGCGECRACVESCPTGAICDDRMIDARLCISRATMYPSEGDPATRGWILGCDECQSCCPYNRKSPMHTHPGFDTVADYRLLTPGFWGELSDEDFDRIFGRTPLGNLRRRTSHPSPAGTGTSPAASARRD